MVTCKGGCGRDFLREVAKKWGNAPNGQLVCDHCRTAAWDRKLRTYLAGDPIKAQS